LNSRQFLDIVHSITIRWNFWIAKAFEGIDFIFPFDLHTTKAERHLITVLLMLFIAPLITNTKYFNNRYLKILILITITLMIITSSLERKSPESFIDYIFTFCFLVLGLVWTAVTRRRLFIALVFVVSTVLSVELLRLLPTAQPLVDKFQEYLEDVPIEYRDDPSAP
jgi:hypothetical protein